MTKYQIEVLNTMRSRGKSPSAIAAVLQISVNTVRSYMRRHPPEDVLQVECLWRGKPIVQVKAEKPNGSAPTSAGILGGTPTRKRYSVKPIIV